ncbi:MAG: hypothetical protein ABIG20_03350 [archaeon]
MPKDKGQAAIEYMSTVGIALVIIMAMTLFAYTWTSAAKDTMYISTARSSVNALVEAADLVYAQGYPARTTVLVQIPQKVHSATITGNEISIRIRVGSGFTDVHAVSKVNLQGELPTNSGYYNMLVKSEGYYVNVTQQS